jgi:hypothetical protein
MIDMEINIQRSTRIFIFTFVYVMVIVGVLLFMEYKDVCVYFAGMNSPTQGCITGELIKSNLLMILISSYILYIVIEFITWMIEHDLVLYVGIGFKNKKLVFNSHIDNQKDDEFKVDDLVDLMNKIDKLDKDLKVKK